MKTYMIIPRSPITAAYISEYSDEKEAFAEAMRLAQHAHVTVDVCLKIGAASIKFVEERVER